MKRIKNNQNYFIIKLLFLFITCISIGYAILNKNLNINGTSNIEKNTWNIHFDNIEIRNKSVTPIKEPIIENDTSINFEIMLNLPGDFYEFTVDVVNSGTIDAMIDSIIKIPELTESQKKYIDYYIEYQNGYQIASKQLIKANESVKLKVRVEYKDDLTESDLPTTAETLNLSFTINYIQADANGVEITDNDVKVIPTTNGSLDNVGTIVTIGTEQFYVISSDENNVKLFAMYNLYAGGTFNEANQVWTPYGDEATSMQDENMKSLHIPGELRNGVTPFGESSIYEESFVKKHVDNYKTKLTKKFGINILEATLITYEELKNPDTFDCPDFIDSCSSNYNWINSSYYWTKSAYSNEAVWAITKNRYLTTNSYEYNELHGVRPVIVMKKSDIKPLISFTIDDTTYNAEEGMTWEQWVNSEYSKKGDWIFEVSNNYIYVTFEYDEEYDILHKYEIAYDINSDKPVHATELIEKNYNYYCY